VIAAIVAKYETLTATLFPGGLSTSRPPIWLDEAPQEGATGSQQRVPYTIIEDLGGTSKWTFGTDSGTPGQNAILNGAFALEVYYVSLGDCDTAMGAILWNGLKPNARNGLAFATLTLTTPYQWMSAVPTTDQHSYAGFDYLDQRVHKLRQKFKTQVALVGEGF
jgi:hypothetical protein